MPVPFPPNCPPADAVPKPGTYYRLGRKGLAVGDVTTADCWLRPYETRRGELYKQPERVEAHALSVFAVAEDLHAALELTPWLAQKPVAAVTVGDDDGVLLHTPQPEGHSHHDWWTNPYDLAPSGEVVEVLGEVA